VELNGTALAVLAQPGAVPEAKVERRLLRPTEVKHLIEEKQDKFLRVNVHHRKL